MILVLPLPVHERRVRARIVGAGREADQLGYGLVDPVNSVERGLKLLLLLPELIQDGNQPGGVLRHLAVLLGSLRGPEAVFSSSSITSTGSTSSSSSSSSRQTTSWRRSRRRAKGVRRRRRRRRRWN